MPTKTQLSKKTQNSLKADVVVVAVETVRPLSPELEALDEMLAGALTEHLEHCRFSPEKGESVSLPLIKKGSPRALVIVGVRAEEGGDAGTFGEAARVSAAYASGLRQALGHRPTSVAVLVREGQDLGAVGLGVELGLYKFEKYRHVPTPVPLLERVEVLLSKSPTSADKQDFQLGLALGQGVCLARDLVNEPPNVLTPVEFARRARIVAKEGNLSIKVLNKEGIKKEKMLLHYAVGQGSENEPTFMHLIYKPTKPKGRIAFVGKGITFDSGGLCIKPGPSMLGMKADMAGAGAVLGLMKAVAALSPEVEVHGIIGAAENMPDAAAYRPSDVIQSLSGKGVEIINTDAEGRLVLADALTYAARLEPDFIVDAATLTGATMVALGTPCSAYYTNSEGLAAAMRTASAEAGESFWQMPLLEELAAQLKSDITDLKHTGEQWGGAITAALFLREFTEGVPWMHCDIPGAVFRDRASGLHPKGATGHPVLTFLRLILAHEKQALVSAKSSKPSKGTSPKKPAGSKSAASPKKARSGGKKSAPRT